MAAMVERPLNDLPAPRPSVEIIDVDAFEEASLDLLSDLEQPSLNPRPVPRPLDRGSRRSTPQTIYLLDSDDDDLIVASGSNPGQQPSNSRRILSPPPRNVPVTIIPPVPPVPPRFAGQTSFPMRLQPPPFPFPSPPVIRPINHVFPFENAPDAPVAGPSNHRHHRQNESAPQAAPPSHHVPSMGLGGAIISSNRLGNVASEPQVAAGLASRAVTRRINMPSFASRLVDLARFSGYSIRQAPSSNVLMGDNTGMDDLFGDADYADDLFGPWRDINFRPRQITQEQEYLPSYTHPSHPDPGFTFDFALPTSPTVKAYRRSRLFPPTSINNPIVLDDDDDDNDNGSSATVAGPSSSSATSDTGQVTATLVCAHCSDLLILNAALRPSESGRRVWGLRCGHIIDEKCLNQLGQPSQVSNDFAPDRGRGKGKAKVTNSGASYGDTIVSENQTVLEATRENSIRSRLRVRPGSMSAPAFSTSSSLLDVSYYLPPLKRRRVSNKKKRVEDEYQWKCPVAGCGKVHVSVKVDGVWGPEKEREIVGKAAMGAGQPEARGAIPIFA